MPNLIKSVLLSHSAEKIYDLVNDVESYREFLPWCGGVDILEKTDTLLDVRIHIHYMGIEQYFHTRNVNTRPTYMDMNFVDGPFEHFHGYWRFTPLQDDACKVEFELHYEFKSHSLEKIIGPVFNFITGTFFENIVKRADQIYQ